MIPNITHILIVGIGGFLGAVARYIVSAWVTVRLELLIGGMFPYGTLFVNATGSLMLAIFSVWIARQADWTENTRLLIGTGFFGAYTTFSTYANESILLMRVGNWQVSLVNIIANNIVCLICVVAGLWMANRL